MQSRDVAVHGRTNKRQSFYGGEKDPIETPSSTSRPSISQKVTFSPNYSVPDTLFFQSPGEFNAGAVIGLLMSERPHPHLAFKPVLGR